MGVLTSLRILRKTEFNDRESRVGYLPGSLSTANMIEYVPNSALRHVVFVSEVPLGVFACCVLCAYFVALLFCQFRIVATHGRFSLEYTARKLSSHVSHVLGVISERKVIWIHARAIVSIRAFVKHLHTLWNWPLEQCVRNRVRVARPVRRDSRVNLPVSLVLEASPLNAPVLVGRGDVAHESFWNRFRKSLRGQIRRVSVGIHKFNLGLNLCHALGCFSHREGSSFMFARTTLLHKLK